MICPVDNMIRWRYVKSDGEPSENQAQKIFQEADIGVNGMDPSSIPSNLNVSWFSMFKQILINYQFKNKFEKIH